MWESNTDIYFMAFPYKFSLFFFAFSQKSSFYAALRFVCALSKRQVYVLCVNFLQQQEENGKFRNGKHNPYTLQQIYYYFSPLLCIKTEIFLFLQCRDISYLFFHRFSAYENIYILAA